MLFEECCNQTNFYNSDLLDYCNYDRITELAQLGQYMTFDGNYSDTKQRVYDITEFNFCWTQAKNNIPCCKARNVSKSCLFPLCNMNVPFSRRGVTPPECDKELVPIYQCHQENAYNGTFPPTKLPFRTTTDTQFENSTVTIQPYNASTTLNPFETTMYNSVNSKNNQFKKCCESSPAFRNENFKLYCNYDVLLGLAKQNKTPEFNVGAKQAKWEAKEDFDKYMSCLGDGKNNVACCEVNNVTEPCLSGLCDLSKSSHNRKSVGPECNSQLADIFECHQDHAYIPIHIPATTPFPSISGDPRTRLSKSIYCNYRTIDFLAKQGKMFDVGSQQGITKYQLESDMDKFTGCLSEAKNNKKCCEKEGVPEPCLSALCDFSVKYANRKVVKTECSTYLPSIFECHHQNAYKCYKAWPSCQQNEDPDEIYHSSEHGFSSAADLHTFSFFILASVLFLRF
uniref:Domain of unknown function DB domain-containing protein n=1 Tax=Ditylenchus dipsaci TaxID=166011 RepID=A0A915E838_9BILA